MSKDKLQKHTLFLRKGDWEYIESVFQARGYPTSAIVRRVISRFVDTLSAEAKDTIDMDQEL